MAENNEIYDHLSAARIVYQDTFENELDIIKELKIYLIESGFQSYNINQTLYNFYQHVNIPITQETITNVSINSDPIINDLVQVMFHSNNSANIINTILLSQNLNLPDNDSDENYEEEHEEYDNLIDNINPNEPPVENTDHISISINEINPNEAPTDNDEYNHVDNNEYTHINNIEYTYNPQNNNIINILSSLLVNINNIDIQIQPPNQVFQNVVVTVDDDDFENLESKILTCDHESNCSICMSQMVKDEKITLLKCNHNFHYDCITPYLKEYNYKCPVCRAEVGKAKYNI